MKKPVEKISYFAGISIMFMFLAYLTLNSLFDQRPQYTLIIYNHSTIELDQDFYKRINDPKHKISGYSIGVLNMPDDRINVTNTPLYVLVKMKNREITYVTDSLDKLNKFINELK